MRASILAILVLLLPGLAAASETSSVTLGDDVYFMAGVDLTFAQGSRPAFLGVDESFQRLALGYRMRGGWVDDGTELGTQLGFEYELFLGWTPKESDPVDPEDEVGFSMRIGMPLRIATTAVPFLSAVVLQISAELEAGYARWWTNTARLNLIGGLRLMSNLGDAVDASLEYAAVPFVVTGSPHYMKYSRFEHRILLTAGYDVVGLGVQLTLSHDLVRETHRGPAHPTGDQALSVLLMYRFGT